MPSRGRTQLTLKQMVQHVGGIQPCMNAASCNQSLSLALFVLGVTLTLFLSLYEAVLFCLLSLLFVFVCMLGCLVVVFTSFFNGVGGRL